MLDHSLFSTPSTAFIVYRLFDDVHSDWYEMISHCSFDLHFPDNEWCWASFHMFINHLYLLWRNVCLGLFLIFWLGCLFFWYWVIWTACIFWKLILCQLFHLVLFSPILFHFVHSFLCWAKSFSRYFHSHSRWRKKERNSPKGSLVGLASGQMLLHNLSLNSHIWHPSTGILFLPL